MLVSPTNLLAVLKIIADLWKVEQQNKNAIEIAEKAGALYDKFVGFLNNLETVGKKCTKRSRATMMRLSNCQPVRAISSAALKT